MRLCGIALVLIGHFSYSPALGQSTFPIHDHQVDAREWFRSISPDDRNIALNQLPSNLSAHLHFKQSNAEVANTIDTDQNRQIGLEEFLSFVDPRLAQIWAQQEWRHTDRDHSTALSLKEFKTSAVANLQTKKHTNTEFKKLFEIIDSNR